MLYLSDPTAYDGLLAYDVDEHEWRRPSASEVAGLLVDLQLTLFPDGATCSFAMNGRGAYDDPSSAASS